MRNSVPKLCHVTPIFISRATGSFPPTLPCKFKTHPKGEYTNALTIYFKSFQTYNITQTVKSVILRSYFVYALIFPVTTTKQT